MDPNNSSTQSSPQSNRQLRRWPVITGMLILVLLVIGGIVWLVVGFQGNSTKVAIRTARPTEQAPTKPKSSTTQHSTVTTPSKSKVSSSKPSSAPSTASSSATSNSAAGTTSTVQGSTTTTPSTTTQAPSSSLTNTGPGQTVGLFVATTAAATLGHYVYQSRRRSSVAKK